VTCVVLDTGALIGLERNDRALWAVLKLASLRSTDVLVPSTALAQAWRGTCAQALLAIAIEHCIVAPFDRLAWPIGELCGRTRTRDICDAHVALVAASRGDVLYTSDPRDMRSLIASCRLGTPVIVRC
jgi:hypothetical protein